MPMYTNELESRDQGKKLYAAPRLTVHGRMEKITKENKVVGPSDGFFLQGIGPIAWAS